MLYVQPSQVLDCILKFSGIDDARTLYCTLLNYDYLDLPIPLDDWSKTANEVIIDGTIIAGKSGFHVLYLTLRAVTRTNERAVLKELLKRFPDCVVLFSDKEKTEFHITSPKYEPESRYKFVIRVTKQFYKEYKTIVGNIEEKLQSQGIGGKNPFFQKESATKETSYSSHKKTAKGFAQQFLNRMMFLYFIQKRGWLNNDKKFVWNLIKSYKNGCGTPNGIYRDWIEPLFFYSFNNKDIPDSYDDLPADLSEIYKKMPYLNGGLFLMNDLDKMGYRLDDALIYKIVDIDDGLLERYNFTIREDTPFDVAVDPEMLGKVYESLIQEEEQERGEAGIFYTPRIEVDFMCRQSLLEYMTEHTGISHNKLISFVYATEGDSADVLSEEEAQKIGNALYNAQIVDPACGSGAFLVQEIAGKPLRARAMMTHLDPICKRDIKELYEAKKNYYYRRADDPAVVSKIKRKEVEIIKKLVDSEIKRIEFRLRPLAATQQRLGAAQTALTASDNERAEERKKLEKEKARLEALLTSLESRDLKQKFFWEIDFAEAFADGGFDIVIANPPYVRQEKIAPQDIPEEEITREVKKEYKNALVRSVTAQWGDDAFKKDLKSDFYVYFYYLALGLLKPRGVFCFISSNSWLDVAFGAKLQAFLLRNIETKAIYDNHAKRSFAEADINTIIVVLKRAGGENVKDTLTRFVAFQKPFEVAITGDNLKAIGNAREKLKTDDFRCVPITQGALWKDGIAGEETKQAEITGSEFAGTYEGNKWGGKYLRAPDIFFTILEKGKGKLVDNRTGEDLTKIK